MEYVPIAIDMHIFWKDYSLTPEQAKLMFFTKGSVFSGLVKSMLISYHYGSKCTNIRDRADISNDIKIYADSGAFQLITGLRKHIDLDNLVEWQNQNADIAFILDVPPVDRNMRILEWREFVKCAERTKENVEKTIHKFDVKVFGVLHGTTFKEMELWYSKLKGFDFDGWAIATKRGVDESKHDVLVKQMLFSKDVGFKRIHVLGIGGEAIPFLAYVESNNGFNISFDVSNANLARYASYILPNGKRIRLSRRNRFESEFLPCDCPICKYVEKQGANWFTSAIGDTKRVFLIDMHNLWLSIREFRMYCSLVKHPDFLSIIPDKSKRMIESYYTKSSLLRWL